MNNPNMDHNKVVVGRFGVVRTGSVLLLLLAAMNAPDREENVLQDEHEIKLGYTRDIKITNSANFIVCKEDHTLGNLLRMKLLEDDEVVFAGYRHPHPLEIFIELKVRTKGNQEPLAALKFATNQLLNEINTLENRFRAAVEQKNSAEDYDNMNMMG